MRHETFGILNVDIAEGPTQAFARDRTIVRELDEATRIEALNIAHKLAGSLGMYGYQQGTEVASKMEGIFKSPTPEKLLTLRALSLDLRNSLADGL